MGNGLPSLRSGSDDAYRRVSRFKQERTVTNSYRGTLPWHRHPCRWPSPLRDTSETLVPRGIGILAGALSSREGHKPEARATLASSINRQERVP